MMSTVLRANDRLLIASSSRILSVIALSGVLLAAGCKKAPEATPAASPSTSEHAAPSEQPRSPAKPAAIVEIPSATPAAQPTQPPVPRIMYVNTAFEAVSNVGTHQFPVNARVSVVGEEGEDYIVEYKGVSVKNKKALFSDAMVEEIGPLKQNTASRSLDSNFLGEAPPTQLQDAPAPVADPSVAGDEKKSTELINEIRTVNEEIRVAEDKLSRESSSATNQKSAEAASIEKLKKRRDKLSEDLTTVAKP